jgi:hypothetical protein
MEIIKTIITACGGAAVAGIFSLILANRKNNSEIVKRLDALDGKLVKHIEDDAACRADEARSRILRFGDEVRQGVLHTAEHWADVLRDVDRYEDYCSGHPQYENNRSSRPASHRQSR